MASITFENSHSNLCSVLARKIKVLSDQQALSLQAQLADITNLIEHSFFTDVKLLHLENTQLRRELAHLRAKFGVQHDADVLVGDASLVDSSSAEVMGDIADEPDVEVPKGGVSRTCDLISSHFVALEDKRPAASPLTPVDSSCTEATRINFADTESNADRCSDQITVDSDMTVGESQAAQELHPRVLARNSAVSASSFSYPRVSAMNSGDTASSFSYPRVSAMNSGGTAMSSMSWVKTSSAFSSIMQLWKWPITRPKEVSVASDRRSQASTFSRAFKDDFNAALLIVRNLTIMDQGNESPIGLLPLWNDILSKSITHSERVDYHSANDLVEPSLPQARGSRLALNPASFKRLCWDVLSIAFVLYDVLLIPLAIFGISENPLKLFTFIFWNVDIVCSFITGYERESSIEMRLQRIVHRYLTTWFLLDILIVAPDWIELGLRGDDASSIQSLGNLAKVFRTLRVLRLLRILRVTRAWRLLRERLTNEYILAFLDFGKLVCLVVVMNHYFACAWYGIGQMPHEDGWVKHDLRSLTFEYKYLTSLHWAMSQFHGSMDVHARTSIERLFSIICSFCGMLGASTFISAITSLIMRAQKLRQEKFLNKYILLRYLEENRISTMLTVRIKAFVRRAANADATGGKQVELLKILPTHLLEQLDVEIKTPVLQAHILLKVIKTKMPSIQDKLCIDVVKQASIKPGGLLFEKNEKTGKTFIVWKGQVVYHHHCENQPDDSLPYAPAGSASSNSPSIVSKQPAARALNVVSWVSSRNLKFQRDSVGQQNASVVQAGRRIAEMSLFTVWHHCGECLIIGSPTIFSIDVQDLGQLLKSEGKLDLDLTYFLARYTSQYIEWMRHMPASDLNDLSECHGKVQAWSRSTLRHLSDFVARMPNK